MMNLQIDPEVCCKLPRPYYNPENESKCLAECSNTKKRIKCCIRKCRAEKLGIYVNGNFNKEALKKFLLNENDDEESEGKLKESWKMAIDNAVEFCAEKCESFLNFEIFLAYFNSFKFYF